MEKIKVGDKLKTECQECCCNLIYEVANRRHLVEYNDGFFDALDLKNIEGCCLVGHTTTVKVTREGLFDYELVEE